MADEKPTPGTSGPAPDDGSDPQGSSATAAAPPEDGSAGDEQDIEKLPPWAREQIVSLERTKKQLLSEKTRVEQERERLEAERAQIGAPPTPDPRLAAAERELEQARRDIAEVEQLGQKGDPYANTLLRSLRLQEQRHVQVLTELEIDRLPEAEREPVRKFYQEGRGEFRTVRAARLAYLGEQAGRKREDDDKEPEPEPKREPATVVHSVTARQNAMRQVTRAQYAAEHARLTEAGDFEGRRKLVHDKNVRITD